MTDTNMNTGDWNTGNWNAGDWNTGNWNTGHRNTGNRNTGNRNTGNLNAGDWNTGDWNTGNGNTGNWNTGHRNTGFFCTETPSPMFFDEPCNLSWDNAIDAIPTIDLAIGVEWVPSGNMSNEEKDKNPNHVHIGGYLRTHSKPLREVFPLAWSRMDETTRQRFMSLPNFDAEKFLQITGVDVRTPGDMIVVNGITYHRV